MAVAVLGCGLSGQGFDGSTRGAGDLEFAEPEAGHVCQPELGRTGEDDFGTGVKEPLCVGQSSDLSCTIIQSVESTLEETHLVEHFDSASVCDVGQFLNGRGEAIGRPEYGVVGAAALGEIGL